jgi:hypothetical protein
VVSRESDGSVHNMNLYDPYVLRVIFLKPQDMVLYQSNSVSGLNEYKELVFYNSIQENSTN